MNNAVAPLAVFAFTSAFAASKAFTTSRWPFCAAKNNAVVPSGSVAFTSAFAASSALTRERSPAADASLRLSRAALDGAAANGPICGVSVTLHFPKLISVRPA
jgi:hypothetical protein